MAAIIKNIKWLHRELGLPSVWTSGRDTWLIILARHCRMIAFGTNSLILALFFAALKFTDYQIGLFMTFTLCGDVVLSFILTQIADKIGRRRVLFGGSVLMVCSGIIFALSDNFWILLFAAVVGVISTMGGDFGPFRSIEESMLSTLTDEVTRPDVLCWYVIMANLGSCFGSEGSGRIVQFLLDRGWDAVNAYHGMFWIYSAMGVLNIFFVCVLSSKCEAPTQSMQERAGNQRQEAGILLKETEHEDDDDDDGDDSSSLSSLHKPIIIESKRSRWKPFAICGRLFTDISPKTRSVMYKLWFLLMGESNSKTTFPLSNIR
jgi:MFS family permease